MIIPRNKLFDFLYENRFIIAILIIFVLLRLPGLHLPYYQDEWKNVSSASSLQSAGAFFSHPPLMQIWFTTGYSLLGENQFRILPLFFSLLTLILLYAVTKKRFGKSVALISCSLFTVCFYSILGSLMVDVDGSVIPFLFLLAVYFYDQITSESKGQSVKKWFVALIVVCLIGFLIKLSFILAIGTIVIDYLFSKRKTLTWKKGLAGVAGLITFGVIYVCILYFIQAIYPYFSISFMLGHANQFAPGVGRDYIQVIVQGVKAIFYLSPLLIIPLIFTTKETFVRARLYFIYIAVSILFYFVVFDFSRGALDKYLMFMIVPLSVISGVIISDIFKSAKFSWSKIKWPLICGLILAIIIFKLNFLPHAVLSLYPKTEWFSRVFHGEWNFLNPFNGGSGPMGFYVSFLFIAISFITSVVIGIIGFFKKEWRYGITIVLVAVGFMYSVVIAEELMFGKINGSSAEVMRSSVEYIGNNASIKQILTYNDIGKQEISKLGKSVVRFYAAPQFESNHRKVFADFKGQYLVVDIPHISEDIFYGKFFAKCNILFETTSGKITGKIYDCPNSKAIIDSI